MMLIDDFDEFFALVNDGARPFVWQRQLVQRIAETGRWPRAIAAPTGAGKSVVVEAHVFLSAWANQNELRLPRRLSIVVGRRALVDSHQQRAERILAQIEGATRGLLKEIRDALVAVAPWADESFAITTLRGALAPDRGWVDDPVSCQIICATPDMWGSRLLFGGYGSSWRAAPREAGMLALDSVVVIDEAHLNRQLLCTARRVGELVERTANELGVPALQVVSMTATPTEVADANTVGVTAHGLESDSQLAARLTVPKLVTSVTSSNWRPKAKASAAHVELLCAEVERLRASYEGTIGCVVNRVDTAVRVAAKLRKAGLDAALWVGRLRPIDAQQLRNHNPELFDSRLSPTMDVLVATQTVEVGVDLDLPAMVTELAPATSLVQRAGRINRRGSRDSGSLVVVRPEQTVIGEDAPPYKGGDLQRASDWLDRLIAESGGISADALLAWPPPLETPHRMQFMRPELHDTRRWASTSTQWLVDEDLELWLRDDLQPNSPEAGLVVRGQLPEDPLEALELLRVTLPSDDEAFPVKIGLLRDTITNILEGRNAGPARAFLWRGGGMEQLEAATLLRPGDVAIIDCGHAVTTERVVVGPADAVLEELEVGWGSPGRVVVFPESDEFGLLELLAGLSGAEAQDRFAEITDSTDLLAVPAGIDPSCSLPWLVRTPAQQILDDEGYRQTLSLRNEAWPLDEHQDLVAARAEELGRMCGLPEALVLAEYTAGAHHDDGKSRPEFQRERLGNRSSGVPVAKSAWKNTQPAWRGPSSLPVGWRHEHLSVAMADLAIDLTHPHRDLCLRLIGTSHGHGRGVPPHGTQDLTVANDAPGLKAATQRLFDEGGWNELLELTDLQFGVWGCAFLEALLRAADCQVSKEGQ